MVDLRPLTRDDLVAMARRISIPQSRAVEGRRRGQVWRASWSDSSSLVVLLDVGLNAVSAAPLLLDFDRSSFEEKQLSTFSGISCLVVTSHSREIAEITLDGCFGEISLPDEFTDESGGDNVAIDELADFDLLAGWLSEASGDGTLGEKLRRAGLTPPSVAEALTVTRPTAVAILRGQQPLSKHQAELISEPARLTAEQLLAANPSLPTEWLLELKSGAYRSRVKEFARRRKLTDIEGWRDVGYGAFALAARQNTKDGAGRLQARVDAFLNAALGEASADA